MCAEALLVGFWPSVCHLAGLRAITIHAAIVAGHALWFGWRREGKRDPSMSMGRSELEALTTCPLSRAAFLAADSDWISQSWLFCQSWPSPTAVADPAFKPLRIDRGGAPGESAISLS